MQILHPEKLIYIDWNLFSILKNPKQESHIILQDFLDKYKNEIVLVYSDAHLGDLSKTSSDCQKILLEDLQFLSDKTNNLLVVKYFGRGYLDVEKRDVLKFYEANNSENSTEQMFYWQTIVKTFTDQYGPIRDNIVKEHFQLDPKEICNFTVEQINSLIKMIGISTSLDEFVKFGLNLRGDTSANPLAYTDYYMTAYMNLDLIGFYPDLFDTQKGFDNLLNDSKHSAYGSMCKAFITNDNKCYLKSKFLFDYYKSNSKLIRTCKRKNGLYELRNELQSLV